MTQIRKGIRSEEVRTGGEPILFVEGSGGKEEDSENESLDKVVLRALLRNTLRVEVMGPSYSVQSAAQSLARYHPKYYFLIDRDHYDDEIVERSWKDFSQGEGNLLVWRRREIENYFLDPPFLVESEFCRASEMKLETTLLNLSQERVFLDVANSVISSIREEQKVTWIKHFTNPADFASQEEAVERLISQEVLVERCRQVSAMLSNDELTERFERNLVLMTGGGETLTYGKGQWINMIRGKKVLSKLLNSGGFKVKDANGRTLTGRKREKEIMKELAAKNVNSRPSDLVELQRLVEERVKVP